MLQRLRDDRGNFNFVSLLTYAGIVVAGYLLWVYAPIWLDYWGVRKAVRVACNSAYRGRSEESVRIAFAKEWKDLALQDETLDDSGNVVKSRTDFDVDKDLDVDLQKEPPQVTVSVHYTQTIVFPLIKKEREVHWEYHHTESLAQIAW